MRSLLVVVTIALVGCTPEAGIRKQPGDDPLPTDTDPPVEPTDPTDPPPAGATVVINEVMPGNWSTVNGPDGTSMPDWVELVNVGDDPVPVSRLELRNDSGDVWVGSDDDGEILPGERLLVWLGYAETDEGVWTGWNIEKDEDLLTLISDGATVLEQVEIVEVPGDVSLARTPDLTGDLVMTAWPTPGDENLDEPSPTLDPADETFFRTDVVTRIDFTLTPEAYQRLSDWERPEVHGEMELAGVKFPDVGLKLKGSASYSTMDGKPAFVVDLNQWVTGTKFRGLKAFKLHNGNVLDPTRVRDHLSYKLAREAGLMAPRIGWAQLFVNGEDFGIYIVVEKHDDPFIEYHHPGQRDLGMVFEPNEPQTGTGGWGDFGDGDLNWNYEEGPIPLPSEAQDALRAADELIAGPATNQAVEDLWNYMEKDQVLTYLAWEAVVSHTDGYKSPNNWRLFVDGVTFKIEFLPSGAEWTWDYDTDINYFGGNFGDWCLSNQSCKHDYAEKVVEVADLADQLGLLQEFQDLSIFLDPWIQTDPRYVPLWGETIDGARASTLDHVERNPELARDQVCSQFTDLCP